MSNILNGKIISEDSLELANRMYNFANEYFSENLINPQNFIYIFRPNVKELEIHSKGGQLIFNVSNSHIIEDEFVLQSYHDLSYFVLKKSNLQEN